MIDQPPAALRWDIFCRVIDNFGDAGVCWRLAADLASRGELVRLYIDQPEILAGLTGKSLPASSVSIHHWPEDHQSFAPDDLADVVIEAFACDPPSAYVLAMSDTDRKIAWINLEYLSAEKWVETHHLVASPNPRHALTKYFYFPGFTPGTGGLLREPGLIEKLKKLEAAHPSTGTSHLRLFLFSYQQPALECWLDTLNANGTIGTLSVAPCPAEDQIEKWMKAGNAQKQVKVEKLAFVAQEEFDAVLSGYDWLFVRGEDSFVRAQWAGKPLVWHIYPQDEDTHLLKLRAFYDLYLDQGVLTALQRSIYWQFVLVWNNADPSNTSPEKLADLWPQLASIYPALLENAHVWRNRLIRQPDLVSQLRDFVSHLVKC